MSDPHASQPPFAGRRRTYLLLKVVVLVVAVLLAIRLFMGAGA